MLTIDKKKQMSNNNRSVNCFNIIDLKRQAKALNIKFSRRLPRRALCALVNAEIARRELESSRVVTTTKVFPFVDNGILNDYSIVQSVDSIVNGTFDIDRTPPLDQVFVQGDVTEDSRRNIKSVATDFVVNDFFSTNETLYGFLQLVYGSFSKAISQYVKARNITEPEKILFVYKGGNVMRMVSNEFILELPANATRQVDAFYRPYFKRSDADFSIYIHPDIADYDRVYRDMTLLAYLLQSQIRNVFLASPVDFFDFFKYNDEFRDAVEKKNVEELNKQQSGVTVTRFYLPQAEAKQAFAANEMIDTARFFLEENFGEKERKVGTKKLTETRSFLAITYNDALDFATGNSRRAKFTLVRTKVLFDLTEKIEATGETKRYNVGGELIDVSVPHRLDSNVPHFFESVRQNVSKFTLSFGTSQFTFDSLSLKYLVDDLQTILFEFNKFPWLDQKYEKRIHRLFYLYFVQIFISVRESNNRVRVLEMVRDMVFEHLSKDFKAPSVNAYLQSKTGKSSLFINAFVRYLQQIVGKLTFQEDRDQFQKMILLLIDDANMMINVIEQVQQYCTTGGTVNPSNIYAVDIDALQ